MYMCVCTVVVVIGGAGAESGHREGESGEGTEEGRGQRYSGLASSPNPSLRASIIASDDL